MAPPWTSSVVSKGVETSTLGIYRIWKHDRFKQIQRHSKKFTLALFVNLFWDNSTSIDSTCKLSPATGFEVLIVEEQLAQQLRKSGLDVGAKAVPDKPTHGETLVEAVCTCTQYEVRFQDTQIYDMGQIWDLLKI